MDAKSIFSINTNQTGFKGFNTNGLPSQIIQNNHIHDYFYKLLPTFSKQCPYLAKIFYLQLLLRENILIFTEDRVDVRDIWLSISRILDLKKPQIYVIDEKFNINELLTTKNEYQRALLYDVSKISVENLNKMLNSQTQVSLMGIQNPNMKIGAHITDFFSFMLIYSHQQNAVNLVDTFNHQMQIESSRTFDKKSFNESVKLNFQIVVQQGEEEGFLKPFLEFLQIKLDKVQIKISQSKWKKMLRIVKFIGVNRQQGQFKKMSLGDFILSPQLLASSIQDLAKIRDIVSEALIQFIPYYGLQKFEKSIKNHFWFSKNHLDLCKKVLQSVQKYSISFFYPCVKFPETASLKSNMLSYRIQGFEKKLMSDHHIEIEPENKYLFNIEIKSDCKMTVHLGVACYDKLKNVILPVQACRKENSEVIFMKMEGDKIHVKNAKNLQNWTNNKEDFAYERAIGVYFNGDTQQTLQTTQILYNQKEPYSKTDRPYNEVNIHNQQDEGEISLSPDSKHWFVNYRHLLQKNKTILMNHFEGGVGCIGESLQLENSGDWKNVQIPYHGALWNNTGRNFFPSTKYVRVVLMVNYNEGYPNFEVANKNATFQFRNIKFMPQ